MSKTKEWSLKERYGFTYYQVKKYLNLKKFNFNEVRVRDYSCLLIKE